MELFTAIIKKCFQKPENLQHHFILLLPIVFSQIFQRFFPIIDNRYIAVLGQSALYIHNLQYVFITFGQFIGLATYISCLVFFNREECKGKEGSVLINHLLLSGTIALCIAITAGVFSYQFVTFCKVQTSYIPLAIAYLRIGLINMILQTLYCTVDGILVASKKQNFSMKIAFVLVILNIIIDSQIVSYYFHGSTTVNSIYYPMIILISSTTILYILAISSGLYFLSKNRMGWDKYPLPMIMKVWWGELGVYLIRGITPFILALQFVYFISSSNFLVTYQLTLQLAFIICMPFVAAMQIAIREASQTFSQECNENVTWWPIYFYTGIIPTSLFLTISLLYVSPLFKLVYGYIPNPDQMQYVIIFLGSSFIAQIGNGFTVPLRATKNSHMVTKNYFLTEILILIGITEVFILFIHATPKTFGLIMTLFSTVFAILCYKDILKLEKRYGKSLV
ncbi:MAG: hypothetical protein KIT27_06710 [Legionellales bacterium]|nr:hypothetical protein [Legionellales bacterium]